MTSSTVCLWWHRRAFVVGNQGSYTLSPQAPFNVPLTPIGNACPLLLGLSLVQSLRGVTKVRYEGGAKDRKSL